MSFKELSGRCRGRWIEIIERLVSHEAMRAAIERGPRRFGFCPMHGGVHGDAFRVFKDFADTGGAVCNSCGVFANGFELLKWLNGWTFADVARNIESALEGVAGCDAPKAVPRRPIKAAIAPTGVTVERLQRLWDEAAEWKRLEAAPMHQYLRCRCIEIDDAPMLRCHPALPYFNEDRKRVGEFPAMLAALTDPSGELVALHRTYLSPEGGKAPVPQPKKLLARAAAKLPGAAVRLYSASGVLGITEGIENALAVRTATDMAVWAATSWVLLAQVEIPMHVRSVVIWADRDVPRRQRDGSYLEPGREAADRVRARLASACVHVETQLPPALSPDAKADWNDILRIVGRDGFSRSAPAGRLPSAFGLSVAQTR